MGLSPLGHVPRALLYLTILPPLALGLGVIAGVARLGIARRVEQRVAKRLPPTSHGLMHGAEPIMLDGAENAALLLHGFGDTPQSLRALAMFLSSFGWTVRAPLLPGHGRSLREFAQSSASDWINASRTEYEHLTQTHSPVVLVGQSMGGALATVLAAEKREIPALILLAPYLTMLPKVAEIARRRHLVWIFTPYVQSRAENSIWNPAEKAKSLGYGVTPTRLLGELAEITRAAWEAAPDVKAPTLMIQSRHDNRIRAEDAQRVFDRLGARPKELVWMDHCGHVVAVDFGREQVFAMSEAWFARFGLAPGDPGRNSET
jgi:carboxylesterase